jgi:hypothetical protein
MPKKTLSGCQIDTVGKYLQEVREEIEAKEEIETLCPLHN